MNLQLEPSHGKRMHDALTLDALTLMTSRCRQKVLSIDGRFQDVKMHLSVHSKPDCDLRTSRQVCSGTQPAFPTVL